MKQRPIRWRAAADLVAHAFRRGDLRTLCDRPITAERFAWPSDTRCEGCQQAVRETRAAA